jgi:hypothetical protein
VKRRLLMLAAAAGATAVLATAAGAARVIVDDVVNGPICADLGTNPFSHYDGQTLTFLLGTATTEAVPVNPTCNRVKYTLYVLDERTDTVPIATKTVHGDWNSPTPGLLTYTIPVSDDDGIVWAYAETRIRTGPVLDRAPDLFSVDIAVNGVPDARPMR